MPRPRAARTTYIRLSSQTPGRVGLEHDDADGRAVEAGEQALAVRRVEVVAERGELALEVLDDAGRRRSPPPSRGRSRACRRRSRARALRRRRRRRRCGPARRDRAGHPPSRRTDIGPGAGSAPSQAVRSPGPPGRGRPATRGEQSEMDGGRVLAGARLRAWPRRRPVERGEYLVRGPAGCGNCHTPLGPDGRMEQELGGRLSRTTNAPRSRRTSRRAARSRPGPTPSSRGRSARAGPTAR